MSVELELEFLGWILGYGDRPGGRKYRVTMPTGGKVDYNVVKKNVTGIHGNKVVMSEDMLSADVTIYEEE
jgi:hypothetical protein